MNSSQAWNELAELARRIHAPVASTLSAKGAYPEGDSLSMGQLWEEVAQKAASRRRHNLRAGLQVFRKIYGKLALQFTGALIQVDIDPEELGRNYPASLAINSDIRAFLQLLLASLHEQLQLS